MNDPKHLYMKIMRLRLGIMNAEEQLASLRTRGMPIGRATRGNNPAIRLLERTLEELHGELGSTVMQMLIKVQPGIAKEIDAIFINGGTLRGSSNAIELNNAAMHIFGSPHAIGMTLDDVTQLVIDALGFNAPDGPRAAL